MVFVLGGETNREKIGRTFQEYSLLTREHGAWIAVLSRLEREPTGTRNQAVDESRPDDPCHDEKKKNENKQSGSQM
jgi:hypothetical protein